MKNRLIKFCFEEKSWNSGFEISAISVIAKHKTELLIRSYIIGIGSHPLDGRAGSG